MKLTKKNKLLIGGILVMLLVSYRFAIQKSIVLKQSYRENLDKGELAKNLPEQLSVLTQKEQFLDGQLTKLSVGSSSMQSNLLKFLNLETAKQKVKIIAFNAPHIVQSEEGTIETYIFTLEGGYTNILKTINKIENKGSFGTVKHLGFEKKKDYRSKRTYLQAEVFLEQVK